MFFREAPIKGLAGVDEKGRLYGGRRQWVRRLVEIRSLRNRRSFEKSFIEATYIPTKDLSGTIMQLRNIFISEQVGA